MTSDHEYISTKCDTDRFISTKGKRLVPSPIRELISLMSIPNIISFGSSMPNNLLFPIANTFFELVDGTTLCIDEEMTKYIMQCQIHTSVWPSH